MADPTPPLVTRQVTYWAISILNSRTFWVGLGTTILGVLTDPEFRALATPLVPLSALPRVLTVLGLIIVVLRKLTIRPVAFIPPGSTQATLVERIGPPPPQKVGD